MTNARQVALDSLLEVEENDAYLNLVLPKLIERARLGSSDAAFATELAYGTARNQGFYDYVLATASGRSAADIDTDVLCALRLGAHQLLELKTPTHAAIFETVELVKRRLRVSAGGFTNAVLRSVARKTLSEWIDELEGEGLSSDELLSIRHSHPLWVTRAIRLSLQVDSAETELEVALQADNVNPKVSLVSLPGKTPLLDSLSAGPTSPIGYTLFEGDPGRHPGVANGSLRVQDQGSQLVTLALTDVTQVNPEERWLDLCAGPGGKAVLLAALAKREGAHLTTNEVTPHRAKLVATALRHSGFEAEQLTGDGRELNRGESFDRILLDAPCTGLGALRRRPESRWRKNDANLKELTKLQRELMEAAWRVLKPGGVLAYVTCSPHPAETISQVEWFLRTNSNSKLLDATSALLKLQPKLNLNKSRKTAQLWPHRNDTDAMFLALVQKASG